MEPFLVSLISVALAEIGDKTQLLAFVLAARFRKPWPIVGGIAIATVVNHAIAAALGAWLSGLFSSDAMHWAVAAAFILMGIWILIPDKDDDADTKYRHGAFLTTLIAFFIVEIGDKTEIATVLLAAKYNTIAVVVAGTTVGMLVANVPVVLIGKLGAGKLPLKLVRTVAAIIFIVIGVLALIGPASTAGKDQDSWFAIRQNAGPACWPDPPEDPPCRVG